MKVRAVVGLLFAMGFAGVVTAESFRDDFAQSLSTQWVVPAESAVTASNGILRVEKPARFHVLQAPGKWQDFVLDVEVRLVNGTWAGVVFRGGYDLFIDNKRRLLLRRDYQVLAQTPPLAIDRAFTRLRVVGIGDDLRVYANGVLRFDLHNQSAKPGPCGLLAHESEAEFGAFALSSDLPLDAAITVAATPPDGALIYRPGATIHLPLVLENLSSNTWHTTVSASYAAAGVRDDVGCRIEGLDTDDLLVAADSELRIDGKGPFTLSRIGYRYITTQRVWPTLYLKSRIQILAGTSAGFVFARSAQGHTELFFDDRGRFVLRRLSDGWKNIRVLGVSEAAYALDQEHTVEITADDTGVTVNVDGVETFRVPDVRDEPGAAGLMFNRTSAVFRDLVISTSKTDRTNVWRPRLVDPPVKASEVTRAITLMPGTNQVALRLPRAREGYYLLTLRVGDGVPQTYPLGVWKIDPRWAKLKAARIPLIVYGKYDWPGNDVAADTYLHAVCWRLRQLGVTGVLHPFTDSRQLAIAGRYGIELVPRESLATWPESFTPSIILVGDEPTVENATEYRERYAQLRARRPEATLLTCMVGEATGSGGAHDPLRVWPLLQPAARYLRHYPVRRASHDALSPNPGQTPFLQTLALAAAPDTPWYFAVQTFGNDPSPARPEPFWRNPNGNEVLAMSHLALAHGARGLFFYTFQTEGWSALVYPRSLAACDDKLAAVGELAAFVHAVEPVLGNAQPATFEVRTESPQVIARALTSGNASYAYFVNADSKQAHAVQASLGKRFKRITDQMTGKRIACSPADDSTTFQLELSPGRGRLLRLE